MPKRQYYPLLFYLILLFLPNSIKYGIRYFFYKLRTTIIMTCFLYNTPTSAITGNANCFSIPRVNPNIKIFPWYCLYSKSFFHVTNSNYFNKYLKQVYITPRITILIINTTLYIAKIKLYSAVFHHNKIKSEHNVHF